MSEDRTRMMMDAGRPGGDNQNSLTVGPRGPVVFEDMLLFEKMAHFNRERIPERVVHSKGSGAHGYFIAPMPTCRLVRPRSCSPRSESGRRRSCASRPWAARRAPRTPSAIRAGSR